jgi:hypothetical protein
VDIGRHWASTSLLDGDVESSLDGDLGTNLDKGLQRGRGGLVRGGNLLPGHGGWSPSAPLQCAVDGLAVREDVALAGPIHQCRKMWQPCREQATAAAPVQCRCRLHQPI